MDKLYLECACSSPEHVMSFHWDEKDRIIYTNTFLNQPNNFFKRLINSVKYLFGYKCKYGHFDCFIMQSDDYERLLRFLNNLI